MNEIFTGGAFSAESLTLSINKAPHKPGRIGEMSLFEELGIATTAAVIEANNGVLSLVASSPRGGIGTFHQHGKRDALSFIAPHLRTRTTLLADSIQDVRAFGGTELMGYQQALDERLAGMRADLEATIEYHRMGAIKGQVLDPSGATIFDLFAEFGVSQQTQGFDLANAAAVMRAKVMAAKRKSEEALGAAVATGYTALCSPSFFDALLDHPSVEAFAAGWSAAEMLREDKRPGVSIGGVVFEEYRGKVGALDYIAAGEAYLIPLRVPGLFITRFAPADYEEAVNTQGIPLYAKSHPLPFNRGAQLEAQTNPINLCTRPGAVVKLTA